MVDLAIRGARVFSGGTMEKRDVLIEGGKFQGIFPADQGPTANRTVRATGLWMLPGIIDGHVHFRDPGSPHRETFATGSALALTQGVTTVLEMPISTPSVHDLATLMSRGELLQRSSHCDFGLYAGAGIENLDDIPDLGSSRAVAFKAFLAPPDPNRRNEFRGLWVSSCEELLEVARTVAGTGKVHAFHAEDEDLANSRQIYFESLLQNVHDRHRSRALCARDESVELVAVELVSNLCALVGGRIHFVHISSPDVLTRIEAWRRSGLDVSVEVTYNHVFFTADDAQAHWPLLTCKPPLRSANSVARLREAVMAGRATMISSDHAPFSLEEKGISLDPTSKSDGGTTLPHPGIPGLEIGPALLLDLLFQGKLDPSLGVSLLSERVAGRFGLVGKGRIEPGYDADFLLLDPNGTRVYAHNRGLSKARAVMAPFDGLQTKGQVCATWVRGHQAYDGHAVVAASGLGRWVGPNE